MFRIKICGVTSPKDAAMALDCGADAVGINFCKASSRYVRPRSAAPIVEAVRGRGTAVAVFVDEAPEEVEAVCGGLGIGVVQLSGKETAGIAARIPYPVIKAVHVGDVSDIEPYRDYPCGAFLLDAAIVGKYGGTGITLDWKSIGRFVKGPVLRFEDGLPAASGTPWLLAGGLTPDNVEEAVRLARPFGVDVASGVEAAPGKKDLGKMTSFVRNAREALAIVQAKR